MVFTRAQRMSRINEELSSSRQILLLDHVAAADDRAIVVYDVSDSEPVAWRSSNSRHRRKKLVRPSVTQDVPVSEENGEDEVPVTGEPDDAPPTAHRSPIVSELLAKSREQLFLSRLEAEACRKSMMKSLQHIPEAASLYAESQRIMCLCVLTLKSHQHSNQLMITSDYKDDKLKEVLCNQNATIANMLERIFLDYPEMRNIDL